MYGLQYNDSFDAIHICWDFYWPFSQQGLYSVLQQHTSYSRHHDVIYDRPLCVLNLFDNIDFFEQICKTILSVRLSKPRGIALDPNEGCMFFTVWGTDIAKLERSNLDGEERFVLIDTKIVYPYGITVDFPNKWVKSIY